MDTPTATFATVMADSTAYDLLQARIQLTLATNPLTIPSRRVPPDFMTSFPLDAFITALTHDHANTTRMLTNVQAVEQRSSAASSSRHELKRLRPLFAEKNDKMVRLLAFVVKVLLQEGTGTRKEDGPALRWWWEAFDGVARNFAGVGEVDEEHCWGAGGDVS